MSDTENKRATTVQEMLEKYQDRYDEFEKRYDNNIGIITISASTLPENERWQHMDKVQFAKEDNKWLIAQLSAYECVLKDLKEIIAHENS